MENISQKWLDFGLTNEQEIIDEINKAFETKEKLDSNIYVGKSDNGSICMCLDKEGKIEKAFPVKTNKDEYIKIKEKIKEIGIQEELNLQVISLFFAIDLNNYREQVQNIINKLPQDLELDLFNCTITEDLTIIQMELGQIVIGTNYVKEFIQNK